MAQSFNFGGETLGIPGGYGKWSSAQGIGGLATNGIIALIGESEAGPDFTLESDLQENMFGPSQLQEIKAKYGRGPLVDAAAAAMAPSSDPEITGAPNRILIVKTNKSTQSKSALVDFQPVTYAYLGAKNYGKDGNLVKYIVEEAQAEVQATTGLFTWIPNVGTIDAEIRLNGGAALALALVADRTPAQFVAAVNALSTGLATGGAPVTVISSGSVGLVVGVGKSVTISTSGTWVTTPTAGMTLIIPDGSVIEGTANENIGAYVITAASSNTIVATKLSDAGKPGAIAGMVTTPVADSDADITGAFTVHAKVELAQTGDPLNGIGKSMEFAELTTGTDLVSRCCYAGTPVTTPATFVSKSGSPVLITSAKEYKCQLTVARDRDNILEEFVVGGEVALKIGYDGATADIVVTDTRLEVPVSLDAGGYLYFKDFPTISDLASYINSKTGWTCAVGTKQLGNLPSKALDNCTITCASTHGGLMPGRVKIDAYRFAETVSGSALVQVQDASAVVGQAAGGLPAPMTGYQFLAGGAKGPTLAEDVAAAITALEKVKLNHAVTLFSRDAADDIVDELTDADSTYVIAYINAAMNTHSLRMSTLKRRKHRQVFPSMVGTFEEQKEAAANFANIRCWLGFQHVKAVDAYGSTQTFQPWMASVLASAMQLAGFYRPIVLRQINCVGAVHTGGFDQADDTQVEEALKAGLCPIRRGDEGGWVWSSDQTTWGKDDDNIYNSIQAVYLADTMTLSAAQRFQKAFVGKSIADIQMSLVETFFDAMMTDFRNQKFISPSDDAPAGYKNVTFRLSKGGIQVFCEAKLAGALYFAGLGFYFSPVEQSA